jgi:hypothetical protein
MEHAKDLIKKSVKKIHEFYETPNSVTNSQKTVTYTDDS